MVWPFFVLDKGTPAVNQLVDGKREDANVEAPLTEQQKIKVSARLANRALDLSQRAAYLVNMHPDLDQIHNPDKVKILELRKEALAAAETVLPEYLNKVYPEFGTHFHDEFTPALRSFVKGYENESQSDFDTAYRLNNTFGDWIRANGNAIDSAMAAVWDAK